MKLLYALAAFVALSLGSMVPAQALTAVGGVCRGLLYQPASMTNWDDAFPITIAGGSTGGGTDPLLMRMMPPVCVCPTIFGFPMVGVGITYWQPSYVAEVQNDPGCLSSLGGIQVLPGPYQMMQSELSPQDGAEHSNAGGDVNRMQVHWYSYPVYAMMGMMASLECTNPGGFDLSYMTEVDPLWQSDAWSAIFAPEATLFANPVAQLACAADSAASSLGYTMDALFWCEGNWGSTYPLSGNSSNANADNPWASDKEVLGRFMARDARLGLAWQTIGPGAICFSYPSPIWLKSEYRYDDIGPIPRFGAPVVTGSSGLLSIPPVANTPVSVYSNTLVWQGEQCCMRGIP